MPQPPPDGLALAIETPESGQSDPTSLSQATVVSGEEQILNSMNSTHMMETATGAAASKDATQGSGLTDDGVNYQVWTNPMKNDDTWTRTNEPLTNELGEAEQADHILNEEEQGLNGMDCSPMGTATENTASRDASQGSGLNAGVHYPPWTGPINNDDIWHFHGSYRINEPRSSWNWAPEQESTTQDASVVYDATGVSKNSLGGYSHTFQDSYAQQMY